MLPFSQIGWSQLVQYPIGQNGAESLQLGKGKRRSRCQCCAVGQKEPLAGLGSKESFPWERLSNTGDGGQSWRTGQSKRILGVQGNVP